VPDDPVSPSFLVNAYGPVVPEDAGLSPPVDQPGLAAMPLLKSKPKLGGDGGDGCGGSGGVRGGGVGGGGLGAASGG